MPGKDIEHMRNHAMEIFRAGLSAVEPRNAIVKYCSLKDNILVVGEREYDLGKFKAVTIIGAGKAGASMSAAVEEILGDRVSGGVVSVKYGHVCDVSTVEIMEAGHPVPDQAGLTGARKILQSARSADEDDLVICLLSGGGSALMPFPAEGITLEEKQETTRILLACGATIHEINAVRKHISSLKGGRLARAVYPATLISLILSDVVGDDLDVIASGPTVPDSSTFADCMEIFKKYKIEDRVPAPVTAHIKAGSAGEISETPKPDDPVFRNTYNLIVASNLECVMAARRKAEELGYTALVLSSMVEGETREVALVHGAVAKETLKTGNPIPTPACVLSGGETTVSISGDGLGGRNMEFSLAAGIDLDGWSKVVVLSAGTDGTDGPTDAAGAMVDGGSMEKAGKMGLNPFKYLADNDSYHFFEKLGGLIKTGPTNTNVMDLRIMLMDKN